MEQYNSIQQLLKKENGHDRKPIYPSTVIQAVFDVKTGASLEAILAQFNSIYVQYQGSPQATRNIIPVEMRRAGLMITYMNMDGETITEKASSAVQKDNDHWGLDVNWSRVDELSLSGDIAVSANGTWIINGVDTKVPARGSKGDAGLTPWLKTIDNKLHYSYDNTTWEPCSDYLAGYFRFNATSSDSQAGTIGKIQISKDNKTWQDLSPEFRNYLRIQGYVASISALPKNQVVGTIYGVNEGTNTYSLHVWDGSSWVNNGTFTSIAAGVVQETGDSETEVMSQKAVTEKLSELGSELLKNKLINISMNYNRVMTSVFIDVNGNKKSHDSYIVYIYYIKANTAYRINQKLVGGNCVGAIYSDDKLNNIEKIVGQHSGSPHDISEIELEFTHDKDAYLALNTINESSYYTYLYINELISNNILNIHKSLQSKETPISYIYGVYEKDGIKYSIDGYKALIYKVKKGISYRIKQLTVGGSSVGSIYRDIKCENYVRTIAHHGGTPSDVSFIERNYIAAEDGYMLLNSITVDNYYTIVYSDDWVSNKINNNINKLLCNNSICCIGDSLTANGVWANRLSELSGFSVQNFSSGGDRTVEAASRMGYLPMLIKEEITIPISGEIEIPIISGYDYGEGYFCPGRQNAASFKNPYVINNVVGKITHEGSNTASSSNHIYKFKVLSSLDNEVIVKKGTRIMPLDFNEEKTKIKIVWLGTNDTPNDIGIDKYLKYIRNIIGNTERYLVLGMTAKKIMPNIEEINNKLNDEFGCHFVDIRKYMLSYALSDLSIVPTEQDETDINNGEIPTSLRTDDIHFTNSAYTIIGNYIYEIGKTLLYW